MVNEKWVIAFDEEKWDSNNFGSFNSKDEAIKFIHDLSKEELLNEYENEMGDSFDDTQGEMTLYVGRIEDFVPSVNVDSIIDDISENARWSGGDYADGYLWYIPKEELSELEDELNEVLHNWLDKYKHQPTFYSIVGLEEVKTDIK